MTLYMYLQCGLGNQLFMIFASLSYAIDHGLNYKIISENEKTMNGTRTYWNNLLDGFKDDIADDTECISDLVEIGKYAKYDEPSFSYQELPHDLAFKDYVLKGYFQSYKYFEHNYAKIKEVMKIEHKKADIKEQYGYLVNNKTIAMHFRIGDYIGLQGYHCIKKPDYYIHALKMITSDLQMRGEDVNDYNILYFCQNHDDEYIDKYLKIIEFATKTQFNFVRIPHDIDDWQQMLIMSLCQHFIIANSTFSWFGAYFSNNENKLVYYPKKWFGPFNNQHNISDLCPTTWRAILE